MVPFWRSLTFHSFSLEINFVLAWGNRNSTVLLYSSTEKEKEKERVGSLIFRNKCFDGVAFLSLNLILIDKSRLANKDTLHVTQRRQQSTCRSSRSNDWWENSLWGRQHCFTHVDPSPSEKKTAFFVRISYEQWVELDLSRIVFFSSIDWFRIHRASNTLVRKSCWFLRASQHQDLRTKEIEKTHKKDTPEVEVDISRTNNPSLLTWCHRSNQFVDRRCGRRQSPCPQYRISQTVDTVKARPTIRLFPSTTLLSWASKSTSRIKANSSHQVSFVLANYSLDPVQANQHLKLTLKNDVKSKPFKQTEEVHLEQHR